MVHCLSSRLLPAEEIPASLELAFLTLGINVSTRSIRLARDLSRLPNRSSPLRSPPSRIRVSSHPALFIITLGDTMLTQSFPNSPLPLSLSLFERAITSKKVVGRSSYMGRGTRVEETRHGFT